MDLGDEVQAVIRGGDHKPLTINGVVTAISADGREIQIALEHGIYVWVDSMDVRLSK